MYATTLVMFDIASLGALRQYFQGFRRLASFFDDKSMWATIASMEEQVRAEEWNELRQPILDGFFTRTCRMGFLFTLGLNYSC